jgi:alanyl-tRNA synthetase
VTERLYYHDAYLRELEASVVAIEDAGLRVYLDRTAFYPTSGGQPFDRGAVAGVSVRDVVDEDDRIAHILEAPLALGPVQGRLDWTRRFDHMQQHTGQHLLSAVLAERYKIPTLSFHMGAELSTIEIGAATLADRQISQVEERCAEVVASALPVKTSFEESSADLELRKASAREGTLRIISIEGIDRSGCGGTHVRSTSEIGPVFLRKLDKVRGNVRVEFVCGGRALTQARSDFRLLQEISKTLSSPPENAPAMIASLAERLKAAEKNAQRLATGLAILEGTELYSSTAPDADGVRRTTQTGPIDEAMRARAQAFVAGPKAAFLAVCPNPPSVLLAASADCGIDAGKLVKSAVTAVGGRGGGNAALAQGSVPSAAALERVIADVAFPSRDSNGAVADN